MSGTYSGSDKRLAYLFQNGGGGGGTTVVANPSGEATDELEKLQVGQTIYSIPEGGGGGTPIPWTFVGDATGSVAINISGVWSDADEFCVAVFCDGDSTSMLVTTIAKSSIPSSNGRFGLGGDPNIALVEVSPTQIKLTYAKWSSVVTSTTVTKVYYRKKITGGGSGSSTLAGLSDVNLSSPTDGQVLKYDGINEEWVNDDESGGGGSTFYLNTIYSTEERKVGYWTDGKRLYQRTFEFDPEITLQAVNTWTRTGIYLTDIEHIVLGQCSRSDTNFVNISCGLNQSNELVIMQIRNTTIPSCKWVTIQYTKTTDSPQVPEEGNVIYLPTIYSQEEREVGVWKDGKPLYQKTINKAYNELTTYGIRKGFDLTEGDATKIIQRVNAFALSATYGRCYLGCNAYKSDYGNSNYYSLNAYYSMLVLETNEKTLESLDTYSPSIQATVQYTKTTDTAGSGAWTPSGVPAVHYSTEEQIVGTWIDGKTIYEKTVNIAQYDINLNDLSWTNIFAVANIDYLVNAIMHKQAPNTTQELRFTADNGYIQGASKSNINLTAFINYHVTFQYTKSS